MSVDEWLTRVFSATTTNPTATANDVHLIVGGEEVQIINYEFSVDLNRHQTVRVIGDLTAPTPRAAWRAWQIGLPGALGPEPEQAPPLSSLESKIDSLLARFEELAERVDELAHNLP